VSAFPLNHHRDNPLGQRLRDARLNQGVTLTKAAANLNIAVKYLEAIENNRVKNLPAADYFDKYLTAYAAYLKIPDAEVQQIRQPAKTATENELERRHLVAWPRWFKRGLVGLLFFLLVIFLVYKVNQIFQPPPLAIISPTDGTIVTQQQLQVKGISASEAEVLINNQVVFIDPAGNFSTTLDLQKGLNLIKISAKKPYSRSSEVEIRVLFND